MAFYAQQPVALPQQVVYALNEAESFFGPSHGQLDFHRLKHAAEHKREHEVAMHLWSAFQGQNAFTNRMFLDTVRAYGGRLWDLFPVIGEGELDKYASILAQRGNRLISSDWSFKPMAVSSSGYQTPGTIVRAEPSSKDHHITYHGVGFEMPYNFFLSAEKKNIFMGYMKSSAVAISKTMELMMLQNIFESAKDATYAREFGPKQHGGTFPLDEVSFGRLLKRQCGARFTYNKGGTRNNGVESFAKQALEARGYDVANGEGVMFVPGGALPKIEFRDLVHKSFAVGGPAEQDIRVERGEGYRTRAYNIEVLEVHSYPCDDGYLKDPTESRTVVSQFFTALPAVEERAGDWKGYTTAERGIQIVNGKKGTMETISFKRGVEGSCVHSPHSGALNAYGVESFHALMGGKELRLSSRDDVIGFNPEAGRGCGSYIDAINLGALARHAGVEDAMADQLRRLPRAQYQSLKALAFTCPEGEGKNAGDIAVADSKLTSLVDSHPIPDPKQVHAYFNKHKALFQRLLDPEYVYAKSKSAGLDMEINTSEFDISGGGELPLPEAKEVIVVTGPSEENYDKYLRALHQLSKNPQAQGKTSQRIEALFADVSAGNGPANTARAAQLKTWLEGKPEGVGNVVKEAYPAGGVDLDGPLGDVLLGGNLSVAGAAGVGPDQLAQLNRVARQFLRDSSSDNPLMSAKGKYAVRRFLLKSLAPQAFATNWNAVFGGLDRAPTSVSALTQIIKKRKEWMGAETLANYAKGFVPGRGDSVVSSGDEESVAIGSPLVSMGVAKALLNSLPPTKQVLEGLMKNNIIVPFGILYLRPFINVSTGAAVVGLAGIKTGAQVITESGVDFANDTHSKMIQVMFNLKTTSAIINSRGLQFMPDVVANKCLGGHGTKFIGTGSAEDRQAGAYRAGGGDMFAVLVPFNWQPETFYLDMTGRAHKAMVQTPRDKPLDFPTANVFCRRWGVMHTDAHRFSPPVHGGDDAEVDRVGVTLCVKGHQKKWSVSGEFVDDAGSDEIVDADGNAKPRDYSALDQIGEVRGRGMEVGSARGRVF